MGRRTRTNPTAGEQPRNKAAHLAPHRFQPGQSGNPSGRPKGSVSLQEKLRKYLNEHPEKADQIIENWVQQAAAPAFGFQHLKEALERVDGKVSEKLQVDAEVTVKRVILSRPELAVGMGKGKKGSKEQA